MEVRNAVAREVESNWRYVERQLSLEMRHRKAGSHLLRLELGLLAVHRSAGRMLRNNRKRRERLRSQRNRYRAGDCYERMR